MKAARPIQYPGTLKNGLFLDTSTGFRVLLIVPQTQILCQHCLVCYR